MNPFISIPREKLAELLKTSGSTLTPEQYVDSLPKLDTFRKYAGRARASAWSKNILLVAAVLAWLCLPFNFDLENVISTVGLSAVTFFEHRVHRYFCDWNPAAPDLGFRNQSAFAAAILIYGLYHAFVPTPMPSAMREVMDPNTTGVIQTLARVFYLIAGCVGGISQFGLAWYYRNAQEKNPPRSQG